MLLFDFYKNLIFNILLKVNIKLGHKLPLTDETLIYINQIND